MTDFKLCVLARPEAREVLDKTGISYETYTAESPFKIEKEEDLLMLCKKAVSESDEKTIVLISHTDLYSDNEKIGVPKNEAEAKRMLEKLSGKKHFFVTRLCLGGGGQLPETVKAETAVTMKPLDKTEIDSYVALNDYAYDGAYSPTGKGSFFVRGVNGDFNNINGMPISKLTELLNKKYGITLANIWTKGCIKND